MPTTKPLAILPVGPIRSHSGSEFNFSEADLGQIVETFSGRVPFVPGHPQDDQPQLGFATGLAVKNGRLVVTKFDAVDDTFKAIVNSGELPGISVKLRLPGHPDNPTGKLMLQHIGFLGRSQPAARGLPAAQFQAEQEALFSFDPLPSPPSPLSQEVEGEQEWGWLREDGTHRRAEDPDPQPDQDDTPTEADPMPTTKPQTPESTPETSPAPAAEFAQREADLAQREAEFAQQQATFARRQAITPFLDEQVQAGRLLPVDKEPFVSLFAALPDDLEIEFSQGDETVKQPSAEFLKGWLKRLPKQVHYGEVAPASDAEFAEGQPDDPTTQVRKILERKFAEARQR